MAAMSELFPRGGRDLGCRMLLTAIPTSRSAVTNYFSPSPSSRRHCFSPSPSRQIMTPTPYTATSCPVIAGRGLGEESRSPEGGPAGELDAVASAVASAGAPSIVAAINGSDSGDFVAFLASSFKRPNFLTIIV
ncbi:hypothetical protein VE03_01713 [Pseudogymnoascus sp. 23342-1-I1]|nr:hypothetical protein VE03_01713 [Pseudogymnoascus sp. 23342-1-I1]